MRIVNFCAHTLTEMNEASVSEGNVILKEPVKMIKG